MLIASNKSVTAQSKDEWPCFHGPDRTNKSTETGLAQKWPSGGPRLLLTVEGLEKVTVRFQLADGLIYTAGSANKQPFIYAYNLKGQLVWRRPVGKAWSTTASWASSYTGPRSTPTYDNGNIYFLGELGRLVAFEAKTGKELWHRELMEEFGAPVPEYGYAESVMIDGDKLYVRRPEKRPPGMS
jgi:outer membrane protein assembly factor BamB